MNYFNDLKKKINAKKAAIGVIGLGYVGLPLALLYLKKKFKVIGFDIDKKKIENLRIRKSYLSHISDNQLKKSLKINFTATNNFKLINKIDIIILCLPTPLTNKLIPDLSYIKNTFSKIFPYLKKGQLLILESSTYPGSTREIFYQKIYKKKLDIGKNFFIGYSPEREDPSNREFTIETIPKICSGISFNCSTLTRLIYSKIVKKIVLVKNVETAEFAKIFENTFRSVNIALVNEMKILCHKLKLNIFDVINAAKTKPFGFQTFYPGPGVGGHCIPVDPYYLSWVAKKKNMKLNFVELAGNVNRTMPSWIIKQSITKNKKKLKVLLIGVSYKKNVGDTRESPALDFIKNLKKRGHIVNYYDPIVKKISSRKLKNELKTIKLTPNNLKKQDLVYILTNHSNVNYNLIKKNSKKIIDTRNVYKKNFKNVDIL